jgi:phosphoribosylformylglycinamidine (FGAM) synthase-like amidotransferase family enzyme
LTRSFFLLEVHGYSVHCVVATRQQETNLTMADKDGNIYHGGWSYGKEDDGNAAAAKGGSFNDSTVEEIQAVDEPDKQQEDHRKRASADTC